MEYTLNGICVCLFSDIISTTVILSYPLLFTGEILSTFSVVVVVVVVVVVEGFGKVECVYIYNKQLVMLFNMDRLIHK